jgi:hypothetical protein
MWFVIHVLPLMLYPVSHTFEASGNCPLGTTMWLLLWAGKVHFFDRKSPLHAAACLGLSFLCESPMSWSIDLLDLDHSQKPS